MKFFNRNIIFYTLFLSVFLISCNSKGQSSKNSKLRDVDEKEAMEMIEKNIDNENFVILDTRTPAEYEKGHLENAVFFNFNSKDFYQKITNLDRNTIYLIYCHSGGRSRMTLNFMKKNGFREAYNMSGGIVAWGKDGYKIVK